MNIRQRIASAAYAVGREIDKFLPWYSYIQEAEAHQSEVDRIRAEAAGPAMWEMEFPYPQGWQARERYDKGLPAENAQHAAMYEYWDRAPEADEAGPARHPDGCDLGMIDDLGQCPHSPPAKESIEQGFEPEDATPRWDEAQPVDAGTWWERLPRTEISPEEVDRYDADRELAEQEWTDLTPEERESAIADFRDGGLMSWRRRLQDARDRRAQILDDLRRHGWRSLRNGTANVARVVSQAPGQAMASGKAMARKVLSIQRAAGLSQKLVERSARSVVLDQEPRHQSAGHSAWVAGYSAEVRERVPGIFPERPRPREWFEADPHGPNRDPNRDDAEMDEMEL